MLLEIAGIRPVRLYDLRHTAVTLAIADGLSVKVISDQFGDASIAIHMASVDPRRGGSRSRTIAGGVPA
jgi:integrase